MNRRPNYGQVPAGAARDAAGIITMMSGAAIVGSTFLRWMSVRYISDSVSMNMTGWDMPRVMKLWFGKDGGFSIIKRVDGAIFFPGFWSLLLGSLILIAGILLVARKRAGGMMGLVFGLVAVGVAAVNIVMAYVKKDALGVSFMIDGGGVRVSTSIGIGLWIFLAAGAVAVVGSIIGIASNAPKNASTPHGTPHA